MTRRDTDLIVACAWCGRVKLDEWLDPDEAIRALRSYESPDPPQFSHGICDDCFDRVTTRRAHSAQAERAAA